MANIVFFGSSKTDSNHQFYKFAEELGRRFSNDGHDILTGGYSGIMEAALKGASDSNSEKVGITTYFYDKEPNPYVSLEIKEKSYTDRLLKLIALGDAFIIFPGGSGTLLELASLWAYVDRKIKEKSPIVVFGEQWYEMIQTLGFYSEEAMVSSSLLFFTSDVAKAFDYISSNISD